MSPILNLSDTSKYYLSWILRILGILLILLLAGRVLIDIIFTIMLVPVLLQPGMLPFEPLPMFLHTFIVAIGITLLVIGVKLSRVCIDTAIIRKCRIVGFICTILVVVYVSMFQSISFSLPTNSPLAIIKTTRNSPFLFTMGDIILLDKLRTPAAGDIIYYSAIKNRPNSQGTFGPEERIARIQTINTTGEYVSNESNDWSQSFTKNIIIKKSAIIGVVVMPLGRSDFYYWQNHFIVY